MLVNLGLATCSDLSGQTKELFNECTSTGDGLKSVTTPERLGRTFLPVCWDAQQLCCRHQARSVLTDES